ncbi:hypothetical protein [Leptospira adleri]|uniref:Uncharacterized protein n=1 Tax=Leptospira adleri TaxID=2023186 RepID=A0ABX4P1R4_9LEPT|nr:hypothetical protein [Leptospira adleri]PJZ62865.1 hypothetical protein CH376_06045 [Leptospira adleri]
MKFIWQDDRTGMRSDTTLRTWIVFFLVIFYLISLCALSVLSPDSLRTLQMDLVQWLIIFYGAVGSLYLGKRVNEELNSKSKLFEKGLNRMREDKDSDPSANMDKGNMKL